MNKYLILLSLVTLTGCTLVPTDMFPKPVWYWSADAEQHRANVAADKQWHAQQSTNSIPVK